MKGAAREFCKELQKPAEAKGSDDAVAIFEDGMQWRCPSVCCSELDVRNSKNQEAIWEGTDTAGQKVSLRQSHCKDRSMLIVWHGVGKFKVQKLQMVLSTLPADAQASRTCMQLSFRLGELTCQAFPYRYGFTGQLQ